MSMRTAMSGVLGILTCITCPYTPNYALARALLEIEHLRIDVYIEHTQNYVYSIKKKIRVINQLVISRSIYFKMTLTGFNTSLQVHVGSHSRTRMISQPLYCLLKAKQNLSY